jgi:hypothetical protein
MFISRSSTPETRFPDFILPAWPASEHTSAIHRHDHQLAPLLRPSAAVATAARENGGTLIVMVMTFTRDIGDLGKSRQAAMQKAWHVRVPSIAEKWVPSSDKIYRHAHQNLKYRSGVFYLELAKVGKGVIEDGGIIEWVLHHP